MNRKSGVLMHISSLHGEYSIGSFGKEAMQFIDYIKECGFSYWQVLPFCMVDECNSPYKSYSAFGGNPYFVDLNTLYEKGLLTSKELDVEKQDTPYSCEYVKLYHNRLNVLMQASKRVKNRDEIEEFINSNEEIKKFCEFMALKEANDQKEWYLWDNEVINEDVLFMWNFIQFEFFAQWKKIKQYANEKGIKIIGDIPIYVSHDSCDVWSNKGEFLLDEQGMCTDVAGVPPDYFSEDGQLWGNPLYNWDAMKKNGYAWWKKRISHMFEMFDGVRIDHFRAFDTYWAVKASEKTAKNGKWKQGPGIEFINAIKEISENKLIIAEDLGDISQSVVKLVEDSGFPGMRVFQFAFLGNESSIHLPHNYIQNCVAYSGTHDNNTLLGYLWELDDNTRKHMLDYCGYTDSNWEGGYNHILRAILASSAETVILPVQDLLGYGSDTRLNIPGKADGNWRYRITLEQLYSIDKNKFYHYNKLYGRV